MALPSVLPQNSAAIAADTAIKTIEAILVPIAQNAIETALPELALPVVQQITEAIEQAVADKITALAETGVTFAIIDIQTSFESGSLSDELQALIRAEKSGDQNAIANALQNYANAQTALARDDGGATPQ